MSTLTIMTLAMLVSSVLCFLSNSWLWIWVALEINTLSFCSMIKNQKKEENKKTVEMSMKYLIIQSISSAMLIMIFLILKEMGDLWNLMKIGTAILMIKIAASPFHQWFINIIKNSKIKNSTILMTWQKIAPAYLIMFQMKKMIIPFIIISAMVGSISQINKKKLTEIMAFSSVFNLSWMLLALTVNMKTLIIFSGIYWMAVLMMMYLISTNSQKGMKEEISKKNNKWMLISVAANLAGIPPMAGFLAKWLILNETLKNTSKILISFILTTSALNFYIYLRMFSPAIMKNTNKKQKENQKTTKKLMENMLILNLTPLIMLSI